MIRYPSLLFTNSLVGIMAFRWLLALLWTLSIPSCSYGAVQTESGDPVRKIPVRKRSLPVPSS